jgi:hypothetical protein
MESDEKFILREVCFQLFESRTEGYSIKERFNARYENGEDCEIALIIHKNSPKDEMFFDIDRNHFVGVSERHEGIFGAVVEMPKRIKEK